MLFGHYLPTELALLIGWFLMSSVVGLPLGSILASVHKDMKMGIKGAMWIGILITIACGLVLIHYYTRQGALLVTASIVAFGCVTGGISGGLTGIFLVSRDFSIRD